MSYLLGNKRGFIEGGKIWEDALKQEPEGINVAHELAGGLTNPSY